MVSATETLAYVNRLMQLSAQEDSTEICYQKSIKMYTPCVPNINTNGYDNSEVCHNPIVCLKYMVR